MTGYEFVFITKGDNKNLLASTEELIKSFKGKVEEKEEWGKKTFTYKMKGLTEGFYHTWDLSLDGSEIKTLKTKLNLEEGIIRYLLLRKD